MTNSTCLGRRLTAYNLSQAHFFWVSSDLDLLASIELLHGMITHVHLPHFFGVEPNLPQSECL